MCGSSSEILSRLETQGKHANNTYQWQTSSHLVDEKIHNWSINPIHQTRPQEISSIGQQDSSTATLPHIG